MCIYVCMQQRLTFSVYNFKPRIFFFYVEDIKLRELSDYVSLTLHRLEGNSQEA